MNHSFVSRDNEDAANKISKNEQVKNNFSFSVKEKFFFSFLLAFLQSAVNFSLIEQMRNPVIERQ